MKLLSLELGVFLFVIGVAIFGNTEVWGADWKFWYEEIVKDHDGSNFKRVYYYDRESIVRPSKGIVKVWVKDVDQRDKISLKERKEDLDKSYEKDWEEFQRITKQEESRLGRKVYPNDKYSFQKMREELAMPHCIKYTMKSYQFNCSERTCCQYLEFRSYDKEGVLLSGHKMAPSIIQNWTYSITPESEIEKLYKKVCR